VAARELSKWQTVRSTNPSMESLWRWSVSSQREVRARARCLMRSESGRSSNGEAATKKNKGFMVELEAGRANTGRDLEDDYVVSGVVAVLGRGGDGVEEGKGGGFQWLNVIFRRRTNVT
jgi:hypothetical protein